MLKIRFEIWETVVVMQILEQSGEWYHKYFKASNGVEINAVHYNNFSPGLQRNTMFLRGYNKDFDYSVTCCCFDSIDEAADALKRYHDALQEFHSDISQKTYMKDKHNLFIFQ